jgi:hypothetical protein
MPSSQEFTHLGRQVRARLQVLRKPMVWGAGLALVAAGYVLSQYWDSATEVGSEATDYRVSYPDRRNPLLQTDRPSLGDTSEWGSLPNLSPNLLNDPAQTTPGLPSGNSGVSNPVPGSPGAINSTQRSSAFNPFADSQRSLSRVSGEDSRTTGALSNQVPENSSATTRSNQTPAVSPLQSALDRNSALSDTPSESTDSAELTESNGRSIPQRPLSPMGEPQFQPYMPRTSPPPGSTGYTLPPSFRTSGDSTSSFSESGSGFSNFSRPQPLPGYDSAPRTTQPMLPSGQRYSSPGQSQGFGTSSGSGFGGYTPQSQVIQPQVTQPQVTQPAPFSVPRTPPGQAIGGGQINTFSNP